MTRKIDKLGRLVIPKEMRKRLCLDVGSEVHFSLFNGKIIVSPASSLCKICGQVEDIDPKLNICKKCLSKIQNLT